MCVQVRLLKSQVAQLTADLRHAQAQPPPPPPAPVPTQPSTPVRENIMLTAALSIVRE